MPVAGVRTTSQLVDAKLAQPRLNAWILATFAAVALLLSIIGVYAVLSYAVRNRTSEMGVRLALGAQAMDLLRLVIRHAVVVSAIAAVAGCLAAIFLTRFLGSFLYGVARAEPMTLLLAALLVILAAVLGSVVPALRPRERTRWWLCAMSEVAESQSGRVSECVFNTSSATLRLCDS